jgi:hypothetical protein
MFDLVGLWLDLQYFDSLRREASLITDDDDPRREWLLNQARRDVVWL